MLVDKGSSDVLIVGTDNAGNSFLATVDREQLGYIYFGDLPIFSDEAKNYLRELGRQFLDAHGI